MGTGFRLIGPGDERGVIRTPARSPPVAAAGERGRARALELDVAALPSAVEDLAEQDGAPVAERGTKLPTWCPA